LSVITVLLLLFTGWNGGDLVFRHRVGVADFSATDSVACGGRSMPSLLEVHSSCIREEQS
jgi:hypothetical protein